MDTIIPDGGIYQALHPTLRQVLSGTLRWSDLRPVQEEAYLAVINGYDTLVMAGTAGGKSEAALIPVLDQLLSQAAPLPLCLYVAPVRALINDIASRLDRLLTPLHLGGAVWHGDRHEGWPDRDGDPPAVLCTTPESLQILLHGSRHLRPGGSIRFCIIDEVHLLAGSSRGAQLLSSIEELEQLAGTHICRIGLSATIGNPETVVRWLSGAGRPARIVRGDTTPRAREFRFLTGGDGELARQVTALATDRRVLLFTPSRRKSEEIAGILRPTLPGLMVHHAALSGSLRTGTEQVFSRNHAALIICTSTLELGLDIGDLDFVLQYGPPSSVSSLLQRLGRSGRRDGPARMGFILDTPEAIARTVAAILAAAEGLVEPVRIPRYPFDLLVREILLLVRDHGKVAVPDLVSRFLAAERYRAIPEDDIMDILVHLSTLGYLERDNDLLRAGRELDRIDGGGSASLFTLIGTEPTVEVVSAEGDVIGRIGESSDRDSPFLLGGIPWRAEDSTGDDRMTVRRHRGEARPPRWKGSSPGTSTLLLSAVADLVTKGDSPIPLPGPVHDGLAEFISRFPEGTGSDRIVILGEGSRLRMYTFLGETWNRILGRYLSANGCRYLGSDDLSILLSGTGITPSGIRSVTEGIGSWEDLVPAAGNLPTREIPLAGLIPEHCLEKFWYADRLSLDLLVRELSRRSYVLP